jgi:anaerobic magnesium-protoporphyrin IX monomethyl ester cyclase
MTVRVLLLQLNVAMQDTVVYVNHGLASLAGTLRAAGFAPKIEVVDTSSFRSGQWLERVAAQGYVMAGISIYSNQWGYSVAAARALRQSCGIPVVGGGPHCSLFPEALADTEAFDAFVAGEGEEVIAALARRAAHRESLAGLPGVWTKTSSGEIVPGGAAPAPADLDALADPAYDLYAQEVVLNYPGLMFSRGCPYNCSYCCNAAYKKRLGTVKLRFLSPERAVQRARQYVSLFQPPYLNFDDDTFTKDPRWMAAFLKDYRDAVGWPFHCNARPETVTPEVCRLLKDGGCDTVALGCESGNEELRRTVLNRRMSDEAIIRAADTIRAAGLRLSTFNMVGVPGECWSDYMKTVALNRRIRPEQVQMTVYYPFRGTALGDLCFKQGLVRQDGAAASYFAGSVLRLPGFPPWQIRLAQRLFKFLVFIRIFPAKAFFELAKDSIKALPFGHALIPQWLRLKRLLSP